MSELAKNWVAEVVAMVIAFIVGTAAFAPTRLAGCGNGNQKVESVSKPHP